MGKREIGNRSAGRGLLSRSLAVFIDNVFCFSSAGIRRKSDRNIHCKVSVLVTKTVSKLNDLFQTERSGLKAIGLKLLIPFVGEFDTISFCGSSIVCRDFFDDVFLSLTIVNSDLFDSSIVTNIYFHGICGGIGSFMVDDGFRNIICNIIILFSNFKDVCAAGKGFSAKQISGLIIINIVLARSRFSNIVIAGKSTKRDGNCDVLGRICCRNTIDGLQRGVDSGGCSRRNIRTLRDNKFLSCSRACTIFDCRSRKC